ncbi:MAG: HlyD family efflux transporter periplasmic adaptor subunit [Cytophagales bacterium]|nr:HlyD family efflux transporter periplasmic adaptor subunit [Cytophagales bacterium]
MKIRKLIISFIILLASVFGASIMFKKLKGSKKEHKNHQKNNVSKKRSVETNTISYQDHTINVYAQGRIQAIEVVNISSEVQGKIINTGVSLQQGQTFKKGQLLVSIDNTSAKLRLQSNKSEFLKLVSNSLIDIKVDFPKSFQQWKDYFDKIDIEKKLPSLPLAKSTQEKIFIANKNIYKSFYTIQSEEEQLTKYSVYAPFSGSIKNVLAQKGSLVNPNSRIVEVINTQNFEVALPIPEVYHQYLKIGQKITLETENKEQKLVGRIVRKDAFINTNTQSINVYAKIEATNKQLIEGTYLDAIIPSKEIKEVMEVDRKIVHNNYIYTLGKDSTIQKTIIDIVQRKENSILFRGLDKGTIIITSPLTNVKPNEKVNPLP